MKERKKSNIKQARGITLIVLVISIIVMLILAGVSINAIVGDNGILNRTQYSTFLSEMTAVEEAVQMWKAGETIGANGEETRAIPANGLCNSNELMATERLSGEIGYYRIWSMTETVPSFNILSSADSFNSNFDGELIFFPAGVQDLYYLNNEAIGIKSDRKYLIDAATGMIYAMSGIKLKGVSCYSANMATAVMSGNLNAPVFAESEVSGTGTGDKLAGNTGSEYLPNGTKNPNYNPYGFKIISSIDSENVYKLYNNGQLYGKGLKGIGLQTSKAEMNKIDSTIFQELTIPTEIPSCKKIINTSSSTLYVIDNNDDLWAWGNNSNNKLGLESDELINFTGREAVKLNLKGKKAYNVFDTGSSLFVITTDNKMLACGQNSNSAGAGFLGLGHTDEVKTLTEVPNVNDPKNIIFMYYSGQNGTFYWYNNAPINLEIGSADWAKYNQFFVSSQNFWIGYGGVKDSYITDNPSTFVRIFNGGDTGDDIDQDIINSFGTSIATLKSDGTYLQTCYLTAGLDSGGAGGGNNTSEWIIRPEAQGKKFVKMWRGGNASVLLDNEGNLWGIGHDKTTIGYVEREWGMNYIPDVPFNTSELKDVIVGNAGAFYLLNDGTVYATGGYQYMGLGNEWSNKVTGFKDVTSQFPQVDSLYGGIFNNGNSELVKNRVAGISSDNDVFVGKDGKLYMTGNSTLMFRNDIIEKKWVEVLPGKKVKDFEPSSSFAYIDSDNNLFVAGDNSDYLGLGYSDSKKIKEFTEITDSRIKGKAKKVAYDSNIITVLTTDNKLYASGHGNYENVYPGFSENTDQKNFIEIANNIADFERSGGSCLVVNTAGKVSGFGHWRSWKNTANAITESTSFNKTAHWLLPTHRGSCVVDTEGSMWYSSENDWGNWWGAPAYIGDYKEWQGDGSDAANSLIAEGIEKIYRCGHVYIALTKNSNLYGWGPKAYLGIGESSYQDNYTITKLPINDVADISVGPNWFIVVKKDGTVWGTGSNINGILGRWIGIDRKQPNSRYKTAFDWVECPELEI
ncbi:MAG: hypothetical protein OSJ66_02210 [Clostridia bacterium]|nr:hypothetical protein [Clostridia bacterium]